MMKNSTAVAHAAARHDQARAAYTIERHRISRLRTRPRTFEIFPEVARFDHLHGFLIKKLVVFSIDLCRLDRHRAVEKDRELRQRLSLKRSGEQVKQKLCTTNGKDRNEDLRLLLDRFCDDLATLYRRLMQ